MNVQAGENVIISLGMVKSHKILMLCVSPSLFFIFYKRNTYKTPKLYMYVCVCVNYTSN